MLAFRVVFILGMYLCVFAAMFGCKNDPSKIILGHWFFSPLAKVSFCVYLTHFIVIMNGTYSSRMDLYWQSSTAVYTTIADIFWSVLLATCLSCLIEAPILGLEKIFLRPDKKKDKSKEKLLEDTLKPEGPGLTQPLMISEEVVAAQEIPDRISPQIQKEENNMLL
jgi:peptidoglycan/LPS O-acetylase OafA/YrhL